MGCSAGAHQDPRPALAAGQHTGGRAPGAARHEDSEDFPLPEEPTSASSGAPTSPGDELGDHPLPPAEVLGVVEPEGREPLERARDRLRVAVARPPEQIRSLAHPLQVDDVAGQLRLDASHRRAAGRRALGGGIDPPRRLEARPLGRHLVDPARDTSARLQDAGRGHRLDGVAGVQLRDLSRALRRRAARG